MPQKQSSTLPTLRLDGLKPTVNLSQCSIVVKFLSGTYLEFVLRGQCLKPSEVEQVAQSLWKTSSSSLLKSFGLPQVENSLPSNATISAVRLHKSSSLEESEDRLLSVSVTSPMTA